MAARSRSRPYRVHGSQATAHSVGPSGCSANLRRNVVRMSDHTREGCEAAQGCASGRDLAGASRHRGDHALTNDLSIPRAERCRAAGLLSDKSSRPAVSLLGIVPQARSRTELPCCHSPSLPSTESRRTHPVSASAFTFNSALCLRLWKAIPPPRNVPFSGSFSLSLAEPPTGAPLCGRGAFGSSLKGIPPTVPSSRSAPPPRDERAIPLLTKQKELKCPPNPHKPPRKPRTPAQSSR
jgi:hypothetical protein